ncbi:Translocation protein SEC63 [Nymphon striatum]|nr:Translocation protein SEC63 [Nymphon striatum]
MAGAKFQYDESGGTFFYFILSFLALVLVPCTYYFWPKPKKQDETPEERKECHCENCNKKRKRLKAHEPWEETKHTLIRVLIFIGWLAFLATAYKVAHLENDYVNWDPFEILGIDKAATQTQIKKAYRKMSLVYHPDKETGNEKKFMMLTKAYAALTDDVARKNWEMYGNPDGPGVMSFGIALPSWIVEKENSIWVLGLYTLVFMVALPTVVGIWWYKSIKYGTEQVLLDTTQLYYYFFHKTSNMILKRILMVLGGSLEFEKGHNGEITERETDNLEVPTLIKQFPQMGEKNKERPLCFAYSVKARALIYAHLNRVKVPESSLEEDKIYILKKCPYLVQEMVQVVSQLTVLAHAGRISRMPTLDTLETCMKLSPMVIQALWNTKSPLLQLPHLTEDMLRFFSNKKRSIKTIRMFVALNSEERRQLLKHLSDEEFEDVMKVASKLPYIEMDVKSEVLDDEESGNITGGAIVTVTVTLDRQDMSVLFGQDVVVDAEKEPVLEEENEKASDNQQSQVKKAKVWEKQKKKKGAQKKKKTGKQGGGGSTTTIKKAVPEKEKLSSQTNNTEPSVPSEPLVTENASGNEESDSEIPSASESEVEQIKIKPEIVASDKKSDTEPASASAPEDEDEEWYKYQQNMARKEKVLESKSKVSHSVHCPYFPEEKQEHWWIYIADKKHHSLITAPIQVTSLVDHEEVELKFTAPLKPSTYTYSVILRSDSYVDFDLVRTIKLDVKEPKEVDTSHPQWDTISDNEDNAEDKEDSAISDFVTDDESDFDDDSD